MYSFAETYKSYPNWKLLQILDNPADYKPEALEAAQAELTSRHLGEDALQEAEDAYLENNKISETNAQKLHKQLDDVQHLIEEGDENSGTIQDFIRSGRKQARIIAIIIGLYASLALVRQFHYLSYLTRDQGELEPPMLFFLLWLVLLPIGCVLFGMEKKIGWYLLCIYIVRYIFKTFEIIGLYWSNNGLPMSLQSTPYVNLGFVIVAGLFGFALWAINKKSVFKLFNIKNSTRIAVIFGTLIFTWLLS